MGDLSRDLYANLVNQFYDMPPFQRSRAGWVMNQEWFDEIREIRRMWEPSSTVTSTDRILGLPLMVAEDGGFPHLIAD